MSMRCIYVYIMVCVFVQYVFIIGMDLICPIPEQRNKYIIKGKKFQNVKKLYRVALKNTETKNNSYVLCVLDGH